MENDALIHQLAKALEPAVIKAIHQALSGQTIEPEEKDIVGLHEAAKEADLAVQSVYQQTSKAWQKRNPHRTPIPHFKQGKKLYFSRKAIRAWLQNGEDNQ